MCALVGAVIAFIVIVYLIAGAAALATAIVEFLISLPERLLHLVYNIAHKPALFTASAALAALAAFVLGRSIVVWLGRPRKRDRDDSVPIVIIFLTLVGYGILMPFQLQNIAVSTALTDALWVSWIACVSLLIPAFASLSRSGF